MKTFSSIKRELRTRYRSRGSKSRAQTRLGSKGASEILNDSSAIQLAYVPYAPEAQEQGDAPASENASDSGSHTGSPLDDQNESLFQQTMISQSVADKDCNASASSSTKEAAPTDECIREDSGTIIEHEVQGKPGLEIDEHAEPLSIEETQAVRQKQYVSFRYEAPEDYTSGPARMVVATDGIKEDCVALLMTPELSATIQEAILRERDYARAKTAVMSERRSLSTLDSKIGREIASCRSRLAILDKNGEAESEESQKLQRQKSNLELMRKDVQARRERMRNNIEIHQAHQLLAFQADVNVHLEEAFVAARLLAPEDEEPEPQIEELDITQEYQHFCEKLAPMNDDPFDCSVFDHNSDHLKAEPLSQEEQARQVVVNDIWRVKDALDSARREFDNREAQRDREYQENIAAADNGGATTNESPEAFDVRWVMQNRNLTRNLIDAEAAYAAKKREVLEAGMPLPFTDAGTALEDTMDVMVEGQGYDVSEEQETMVPISPPGVRRWLSKLPEDAEAEVAGDEARGDADEWEAEEVGISDSVSVVAEGKERARIDRWRQACAEARED